MTEDFESISVEGFQRLRQALHERDYLLIDVRQPAEYAVRHIPGAILMPLPDLEERLFELPDDRDLVFYCASGGRALAAASLTAEAEVTQRPVRNLLGGILAWEGRTVADFPRIRAFENIDDPEALMTTALGMEKAAAGLYAAMAERYPLPAIASVCRRLQAAETTHARTVFDHLKRLRPSLPDFDALYASVSGNVLEGGVSVGEALSRIAAAADAPCPMVIEWALRMEYAAFDLYRVIAEGTEDAVARSALLDLSQAEKAHMRTLTTALAHC